MGVIFDILGSFIVRAAIISIVLNLMLTLHETLHKNTDRIYLNEVMKAPSETMTFELKLAGYNASKEFLSAKADTIVFFGDIDNNGVSDQISYFRDTTNKILYRKINAGSNFELARNVTAFTLKYYDVTGTQLGFGNGISGVKSIQITMTIQSSLTMKSFMEDQSNFNFLSATWSTQIFPLNL